MFKKLIIVGVIMFMMAMTAVAASVRPSFVVEQWGMEPATWLALIVGIFALIDNYAEFKLKQKKNSTLKYDYAYLRTSFLAILGMCSIVLNIPVVELSAYAVIDAIAFGLAGNEYAARKTKVAK